MRPISGGCSVSAKKAACNLVDVRKFPKFVDVPKFPEIPSEGAVKIVDVPKGAPKGAGDSRLGFWRGIPDIIMPRQFIFKERPGLWTG